MIKPGHTNWNFQGIKFHNPTQCLTDPMIRKWFTYVMNIPSNNMEIHFLLTGFFTQGCHLAAFQIIKTALQMLFLQSRRSWTCWPLPASVPTGSFPPPLHLHPSPPPPRMLSWASLLGSEKVTLENILVYYYPQRSKINHLSCLKLPRGRWHHLSHLVCLFLGFYFVSISEAVESCTCRCICYSRKSPAARNSSGHRL